MKTEETRSTWGPKLKQIAEFVGGFYPTILPRGYNETIQMDFKNKIRPIIGVRRAGMAQLEQVQHASCHLAGAVGEPQTRLWCPPQPANISPGCGN